MAHHNDEDDVFVQNAADKQQVQRGAKRERTRRERELDDLRQLLKDPIARRVLWRMLEHCRTHESIFEASARIYYNAGVQDVGHYLVSEIVAAREDALIEMMLEHRKSITGE